MILNLLMINPFFKNTGPFNVDKLLDKVAIENTQKFQELIQSYL